MKLTQLIDLFIDDVCAGKANETPRAYRCKCNYLLRQIGSDVEVDAIDQALVDAFKRDLLGRKEKMRGSVLVHEPLSRFTVRTVIQTVRHCLRWGAEHGHLAPVTIRNITEPEVDPKAIRAETFESLLRVAAQYGSTWLRARNVAILYALRDTGSRVGAIARLTGEHIQWDHGYAMLPDKGDRMSWLFFNPITLDALRAWLAVRNETVVYTDAIFINGDGQALGRQGIYRAINRLADVGAVHGRHNPHSFRHAFARDTILAGADLGVVSGLMNHRGIVVTAKYYARWHKTELGRFHRRYGPCR